MFEVSNPDFEEAIRKSFARQSFMATLGGRLDSIAPGEVRISYQKNETLLQQHGFLHAGVSTALVDSACGYAAMTLVPVGHEVLTVEFKVNFLRPADGDHFLAIGRVIKAGKLLTICEGDVVCLDKNRSIAKMQMTMAIGAKSE